MLEDLNILAFYLFAGLSVFGALVVLFSRNIVHAVFMLVMVFLGVAGVFLVSKAEFVGITQILVYIGGILILMMFGVMLTNRLAGQPLITEHARLLPAVGLGVGFVMVFYGVFQEQFPLHHFVSEESQFDLTITEQIGVNLMTHQLLALEITAMLLLMALVGAALLAGYHFKKKAD